MASGKEIIENAVRETMLEMEQREPIHMHELKQDEEKYQSIIQAAREAATEEVNLGKEFGDASVDVLKVLKKHLPTERVELIQKSLSLPTFRMEIVQSRQGSYTAHFKRDGQPFLPPRNLETMADVDWATIIQFASIVVEAILLVLSAVGISLSPSASTIKKTVADVAQSLKNSPQFRKAIASFVTAWNSGGGATSKAKALFFLLKDTYTAGVLWEVIKSLCSNMSTWDWIKTAAKVTASIIAAFATGGAALIAKIALVVLSAIDFAKKLTNLDKLNAIKDSMHQQEASK